MMSKLALYSCMFIFSVFISSVSQIILKKSAAMHYSNKINEYINPRVLSAYGIFLISTLITMYAYKYVPISMGSVLESLGYIFVVFLSRFYLGERLGTRKLIGIMIIIVGIVVFSI